MARIQHGSKPCFAPIKSSLGLSVVPGASCTFVLLNDRRNGRPVAAQNVGIHREPIDLDGCGQIAMSAGETYHL